MGAITIKKNLRGGISRLYNALICSLDEMTSGKSSNRSTCSSKKIHIPLPSVQVCNTNH